MAFDGQARQEPDSRRRDVSGLEHKPRAPPGGWIEVAVSVLLNTSNITHTLIMVKYR